MEESILLQMNWKTSPYRTRLRNTMKQPKLEVRFLMPNAEALLQATHKAGITVFMSLRTILLNANSLL